jgi:hypothetical protein
MGPFERFNYAYEILQTVEVGHPTGVYLIEVGRVLKPDGKGLWARYHERIDVLDENKKGHAWKPIAGLKQPGPNQSPETTLHEAAKILGDYASQPSRRVLSSLPIM